MINMYNSQFVMSDEVNETGYNHLKVRRNFRFPLLDNITGLSIKEEASVIMGKDDCGVYYSNGEEWSTIGVSGGVSGSQFLDSQFYVYDDSDPTIKLILDVDHQSVLSSVTNTIRGSQTADRVLSLPNAGSTLVGVVTEQILTNKTIDGGTNPVYAKYLKTGSTDVNVSASTPSVGKILTIADASTASWLSGPSGSSLGVSGTSTPDFSVGYVNMTAFPNASTMSYQRVGSTVTVSLNLAYFASGTGPVSFTLNTLPVARSTNFANNLQAHGTGFTFPDVDPTAAGNKPLMATSVAGTKTILITNGQAYHTASTQRAMIFLTYQVA